MKLFRVIQKKLAMLGITPAQSIRKQPFNREIVLGYFIFVFSLTSGVAYLFLNANTFEEYTNIIYVNCSLTVNLCCLTIIVFKMSMLFKLINDFGSTVIRSKQNASQFNFKCNFACQIWKCFRFGSVWCRKVQKNLQENWSARRKIEWYRVFYNGKSVTSTLDDTKNHYQLLHLLYHRFGQWLIQLASIDDVSSVVPSQMCTFSKKT